MTTITLPKPAIARHWLMGVAWVGTLLLSRLPQIIAQEFLRLDLSEQMLWLWLGMGVVLITATFIWALMQPLRRYFMVLTAIYGATIIVDGVAATSVWQSWFGGAETAWALRFFGERLGVVLLALLVMALLFYMGQARRDLFLLWGNWQRPAGLRLPGRPASLAWATVGPVVALALAILFGWGLIMLNPSRYLDWQQLILLSPFILLFALMNAFGEEMAFRAAPLSQLWLVLGEKQAVWLTAVWFGLGHYYGGIPSGPVGALMAGGVALLFGKVLVETRGIALPILMHMLIDVAIYAFLALTAT